MDLTEGAHELRSPLTVMLGHMRMLAVEPLTDGGRRRLEILEAQIGRMTRLLDSCGERKDQPPALVRVDLSATIRTVVRDFDAELERRRVETVVTVDEVLPFLWGDSDLLYRLLVNLVVNAAESISGRGRIEINARAVPAESSPSAILVDIADTGDGIPSELIARVFGHGFTTKRSRRGHGFGLAICREIVQMHGGGIMLSSEPGKGTTVQLSLPIAS